MPAVVNLCRYPIKGLSPELLGTLSLSSNDGLSHDREFALALGTTVFDASNPLPLDKGFFLMLRANEQLAALDVHLDCETGDVRIGQPGGSAIEANLLTKDGAARVEEFFETYIGAACKGRPKLVHAKEHKFTDGSVLSPALMRAVSLINLASVRALEEKIGTPINPLRFRGNIYVDGLDPWQELDWVDQEIKIGQIRFRGLARTPRCGAVNVNPETARRDANLPKAISRHFGHVDLGIYLEVLSDGDIHVGDPLG
ncbi:MOSC domain-containing protein [soil metagenome]